MTLNCLNYILGWSESNLPKIEKKKKKTIITLKKSSWNYVILLWQLAARNLPNWNWPINNYKFLKDGLLLDLPNTYQLLSTKFKLNQDTEISCAYLILNRFSFDFSSRAVFFTRRKRRGRKTMVQAIIRSRRRRAIDLAAEWQRNSSAKQLYRWVFNLRHSCMYVYGYCSQRNISASCCYLACFSLLPIISANLPLSRKMGIPDIIKIHINSQICILFAFPVRFVRVIVVLCVKTDKQGNEM